MNENFFAAITATLPELFAFLVVCVFSLYAAYHFLTVARQAEKIGYILPYPVIWLITLLLCEQARIVYRSWQYTKQTIMICLVFAAVMYSMTKWIRKAKTRN